jgi:hypothetical protein
LEWQDPPALLSEARYDPRGALISNLREQNPATPDFSLLVLNMEEVSSITGKGRAVISDIQRQGVSSYTPI